MIRLLNSLGRFVITIPLVAWRNFSGQFLSVDDVYVGALEFNKHISNLIRFIRTKICMKLNSFIFEKINHVSRIEQLLLGIMKIL